MVFVSRHPTMSKKSWLILLVHYLRRYFSEHMPSFLDTAQYRTEKGRKIFGTRTFNQIVQYRYRAVLGIRDILVRIRIRTSDQRIREAQKHAGSYGSGLKKSHKVIKKLQNSRNRCFSYYFAWWWKDPDPCFWLTYPDADTEGPKNIRILRIRIPNLPWQQEMQNTIS